MNNTTEKKEVFGIRYLKLINEIKVPKKRKNNYGKYFYRSCDDILEALKGLLLKYELLLNITSEHIKVDERYYIKVTAKIENIYDNNEYKESSASCRETDKHPAITDSTQHSGACLSYATKYALNSLLLLDDNKELDSLPPQPTKTIDDEQLENLKKIIRDNNNLDEKTIKNYAKVDDLKDVPQVLYVRIIKKYRLDK